MSTDIVLATINARYYHASLGLRYLYENLDQLRDRAEMLEFTLDIRALEIVERILKSRPRIVGLGVYIWNVVLTGEVVALIKTIAPDCMVVLGGPEVGFEDDPPAMAKQADFVIAGQADHAFRALCETILENGGSPEPFVGAPTPGLESLGLPYRHYTDEDIRNRLIYVEASRGCPFKCEFCLSSLDKTAWSFNLDAFLAEIETLYRRGVRHFKFVDRTFNLKPSSTTRILQFFLAMEDPDLFLHFELIPDRLPADLKEYLPGFQPGTLQFEIGIQSFNPEVQDLISRRQDNVKTRENLKWLLENTHAHIHADLIFGLPGEDLHSFACGFNELYGLGPHEIQLGILKRLRGTPLIRHEQTYALRFNPSPPYNILSTSLVDFETTQRMQRFARYWDMIANSGRFTDTMKLIPPESMFEQFLQLSDWIYASTGKTHRIALPRLFQLLFDGLGDILDEKPAILRAALLHDFRTGGFKGLPAFLQENEPASEGKKSAKHSSRQLRHKSI